MAPELFKRRGGSPSTKSDVYSFGIVMFEIVSRQIPWKDAAGLPVLIKSWVCDEGEREDIPIGTPESIRREIEKCWLADPKLRPEAKEIVRGLKVGYFHYLIPRKINRINIMAI